MPRPMPGFGRRGKKSSRMLRLQLVEEFQKTSSAKGCALRLGRPLNADNSTPLREMYFRPRTRRGRKLQNHARLFRQAEAAGCSGCFHASGVPRSPPAADNGRESGAQISSILYAHQTSRAVMIKLIALQYLL